MWRESDRCGGRGIRLVACWRDSVAVLMDISEAGVLHGVTSVCMRAHIVVGKLFYSVSNKSTKFSLFFSGVWGLNSMHETKL